MRNQNIEFQEQYKRLDNLCKDCYSAHTGVTEYITRMEDVSLKGRYYVNNWDLVYKKLKHVRWIRNQLAHEIDTIDSDICSDEDLQFVFDFYEMMMTSTDPLSVLHLKTNNCIPNNNTKNSSKHLEDKPIQKKPSLIKRIINKLKKLFQ